MLELTAMSPLSALSLPTVTGCEIVELSPIRIGVVRIAPGAPVPTDAAAPGSIEARDKADWVCIGPREWLVLGGEAGVDIGSAVFGLSVTGPSASKILARGIAIDFRKFGTGQATRTRLGEVAVILIRDTEDGFRLFAPTPCARYLTEWFAHHG